MNDRHFSNFHIAGFTYYDGVDVFDELTVGTELALIAEPDNGFDPRAVQIYYGETKLGYVPRYHNELISKFLNLDYTELFEVRINRVNPAEQPEKQIGVVVRIREQL